MKYNLNKSDIIEYLQDCIIREEQLKMENDILYLYYRGKKHGILDVLHAKETGEEIKRKVFKETWEREDEYDGLNVNQVKSKIRRL